MEKKLAGLLGAVSAIALATPASAMPPVPNVDAVMQVNSYADLLRPIPNAQALLEASDAAAVEPSDLNPAVEQMQFFPRHHHHHHHHHHRRYYHHHHHHHHHHNSAARIIGGVVAGLERR